MGGNNSSGVHPNTSVLRGVCMHGMCGVWWCAARIVWWGQVPASVVPKMLVHQPHAKGHSFVQGKAVGKMVPEADFVRVQ